MNQIIASLSPNLLAVNFFMREIFIGWCYHKKSVLCHIFNGFTDSYVM